MGKTRFHIEIETNFHLIGISCHFKDYRFVWQLNKYLGTDFVKKEEYSPYKKEGFFSNFEYKVDHEKIHVFSNRSQDGYLVKKKKQVDFWLMIKHSFNDELLAQWLNKINQFPDVLALYKEEDEKTKEIFLF